MATQINKSMRAAGLIVYRWNGHAPIEFLLLQTSYGRHHWTPPKGFVDGNEDALATAIRETKEEAGLNEAHYQIEDRFHKTLHYFDPSKKQDKQVDYWLARLRCVEQPVVLSAEHQDFKWLQLDEACKLGGYADMSRLLREAHEFLSDRNSRDL
ncbi:bis(5'-nucleosyl)-tetraphosphatase [asymmetrical]-like [Paramacrobiotus metropolitanus]|uniref:bis(5'-nucleosyl)-tetraphosphatase [asymmetrical]-like n=1 Tax=Paramacrobiotus metropolitanus TaxID=2943436 RepID=UPI002445C9ED|nr:bis(5'-nucleosyl)-tetraphosphatase [asymmetrical]-like [Paramacrobiotus metropolitanus]